MGAISQIGQLVDMNFEEFKDNCSDKDMGYIKGLENIFLLTYNNLCEVKDSLGIQAKIKSNSGIDNSEEIDLISDVFDKLLNIEGKVFALREIQKERTFGLFNDIKRTT